MLTITEEQFKKYFNNKKIKDKWYCFGTWQGYDHSFCSDNPYHAEILARAVLGLQTKN